MNENFESKVEGTNVHTGVVTRSKLNLIDLAGSERISKTDATGDRLKWVITRSAYF